MPSTRKRISQETISLRFDRCISSQDRLSLFSKLLCLGIVHKEESISSLFSHREGKMQSNLRILESIIRIIDQSIIHRKSCTETKFTSGGDFLLSVALATMTLLKLLNERGSGMKNEVIPGTTNFRVPCVFQFA